MPRYTRTVESQRENARILAERLLTARLTRNGCSAAMVAAFTQSRLDRYNGATVAPAYDR